MTTPWNFEGTSKPWSGSGGLVTLVEGTSFCISEPTGDILPGETQGLFFRDRRLLSRFELLVDGDRMHPLGVVPGEPFAGTFVSRAPSVAAGKDSTLLVIRHRYVGQGMREDVELRNHGSETTAVLLTVVVAADLADLFAVKEGRVAASDRPGVRADGGLLVGGAEDAMGVRVTCLRADPVIGPESLTLRMVIPPRATSAFCLEVAPVEGGAALAPRLRCGEPVAESTPALRLGRWRRETPRLTTDHAPLAQAVRQAGVDLGALQIFDQQPSDLTAVAAGAPWFMTLFGRDSLLTAWMALPLDPQLAIGTLELLARLQGTHEDPVTEEQPGRILHEVRHGSMGANTPGEQFVYYGTADATPLFVMLLGELYRWGFGDRVRHLLPHADRALAWVEEYGDRDGDGLVEYQRATDRGLANQGWKDSWDAISFANGRLAEPPIAVAEVQAYVYAAHLARARIAEVDGDPATADRCRQRAAQIRTVFHQRFWLPDRGYFALALDRDKRPVDALASNLGHCLWAGIIDPSCARSVSEALTAPEMFTGWGVRTLTSSAARYNPASYHNGSVWPHDTAICVAGLLRYGEVAAGQRLALSLLEASGRLGGRLPELFCGFDRDEFGHPVPYPSACSPQAWAAAAPLLILRSLLRLDPDVPAGRVACAPVLPDGIGRVEIRRMPLAGHRIDVLVENGRAPVVTGLPPGVTVADPRTGDQ